MKLTAFNFQPKTFLTVLGAVLGVLTASNAYATPNNPDNLILDDTLANSSANIDQLSTDNNFEPLVSDLNSAEATTSIPSSDTNYIAVEDSMSQVNSVSQLRDVSPSDWAFEALRNLVEKYGCIAGYPDGTYKGQRALTRYEFAAGLNACLQSIERLIVGGGIDTSDLDSIRRLVQEFETELAALGARVDNLEGRVAYLEDHQFSTTTKLFGQSIMGVQGRSGGDVDFLLNDPSDNSDQINVIYNNQISLYTQFTPRSLLLTGLQAGNGNTLSGNLARDTYVGLSYEGDTNSDVQLSDLSYRQLIGDSFALIVGTEGLNAVNVFRGSNRVESAGYGPLSRFAQRNPIVSIGNGNAGAGFDWQILNRLSLQGVYSASRAEDPDNGGLFGGDEGQTAAGAQLVWTPVDPLDLSFQYINSYSPNGFLGTGVGDDLLIVPTINREGFFRAPMQTNAFGLGLDWRITPKITLGGWGGYTTSDFTSDSGSVETWNWMAYLNFPDLFGEGNLGGIYVGMPPKITSSDLPLGRNVPNTYNTSIDDALAGDLGSEGEHNATTTHIEAFYRWRVTDNISLTPGFIVVINPAQNDNNDTIFIGALRTTFSF